MNLSIFLLIGFAASLSVPNHAFATNELPKIEHQQQPICDLPSGTTIEQLKSDALVGDIKSIDAQNLLGVLYSLGCGVPKDERESAKWYRLAAEQGDADAQFFLGAMYANGLGVQKDFELAVEWYRLSADQGNPSAQGELGVMYANGSGVQQNEIVAYALYNICVTNDPSDTNRILVNRSNLAKAMTEREIRAADALTLEMGKPGNLLKSIEHFITRWSVLSAKNER